MDKPIVLDLSNEKADSDNILQDLGVSEERSGVMQGLLDEEFQSQIKNNEESIDVLGLIKKAADIAENINEYTLMIFSIGGIVAEMSNPLAGIMGMMGGCEHHQHAAPQNEG